MNLHLNLASQPFGRRRLFTLAFSVSAAVLGSLAIGLVVHYFQNYELSPQLVAVEARLRAQLRTLQAEERHRVPSRLLCEFFNGNAS